MAVFNNVVALVVACAIVIPAFFVKKRASQIVLVVIAIVGFFGAKYVSRQYVEPHYEAWRVERDLEKQPLFHLIAKTNPQEFAAYKNKIQDAIVHKADQNTIATYTSELINEVFVQHLKNSPDDAVNNYLKATLELYRYLYTKDPRVILKFENHDNTDNIDFAALWSDETFKQLLGRLLEAKQQVIMMAIEHTVSAPSREQAEPILNSIINMLNEKYGKPAVQQMFSKAQNTVPPQQLAGFIIDFYAGIQDAGQDKSGIVMRYIGSLKAPAAR